MQIKLVVVVVVVVVNVFSLLTLDRKKNSSIPSPESCKTYLMASIFSRFWMAKFKILAKTVS